MTTLLQIALPLLLIAWVAVLPARSIAGLLVQGLAAGLTLMAANLALLWTFPPWWTPRLYLLLWAAVLIWRLGQLGMRAPARWPSGGGPWAGFAAAAVLLAAAGWIVTVTLAGRFPPARPAIDLASPFAEGRYLVAHGGSRQLVNAHMKTLDPAMPGHGDWRGQSHAVDLVRIDRLGLRGPLTGSADPARYETFGATVVAPCAGRVTAAEDGRPDMPVPEMDAARKLGNHVILDCGGLQVVLAHLREGSVRVKAGKAVASGAPVAEAGNSGNSSEPHLHLHVQTPPPAGAAPIAGEPLPFTIEGRYYIRNDRLDAG